MHGIKVLGIVLVMLFAPMAKGQNSSFAYYDSLTYSLYLQKDYPALLNKGKEAVKLGMDSYYLLVRTGIAAFEMKKYRLAARYFKNAKNSADNSFVNEYLYYAYLWGGEKTEALKIKGELSHPDRKLMQGFGNHNISVDLSMATLFKMDDIPQDVRFPDKDGFQVIPESFVAATLSLQHRLGWKVKMTHQFTRLWKNNQEQYIDGGTQYYDSTFNTKQFEYYIGSNIFLGNSWSLNLDGHYATVTFPGYAKYEVEGDTQYVETSYNAQSYLLSASLLKDFTYFSLEGEMVVLKPVDKVCFQPSLIVRLFPFANLNLYTQSRFSLLMKNNTTQFFQKQSVGFKLLNRLWFEAGYFSGNVSGFALNNGAMFFNGLEEVNTMLSGDAIVTINPDLKLTFGYQYRKQSNYFFQDSDVSLKSNKIELNYSLLYFNISWAL